MAEMKFTFKVKGKTYFVQRDLSYNRKNVIYLITCHKCKHEFIGLAVDFELRFRVHKSKHCGTSRRFNKDCQCSASPFQYAKDEIIKQVYSEDPSKTEKVFWHRQRYWQNQLFNHPWDEQCQWKLQQKV